jgi:hypothetical protein
MKILTKEIRNKIPNLYSQEDKGDDAIVYVKFFSPSSSWTWYATEGEPVFDDDGNEIDFRFFGLVYGLEKELGYLGYFSLNELSNIKGPYGLGIERDKFFTPKPLKDCKDPCDIHT